MNRLAASLIVILAGACGGSNKPAATGGAATASCDEIASACHPHAEHTAAAKECHELGHKAPSEDACAARKAECLAVCPPS